MVQVLGKDGQLLSTTTRHGKVRRLLKEGKARVVKESPFTIQLLYDIEDFNMTENINTYATVVTDDQRTPIIKGCSHIVKMSYKEFMEKAESKEGICVDDFLYLDVDGLDAVTYTSVCNALNNCTDHLVFFRFSKHNFIKEPIEVLEEKPLSRTRDSEKMLNFTPEISTFGNYLVCGAPGSGKTTLLKNMGIQFIKNKALVKYFTPIPIFDRGDVPADLDVQIADVKTLASTLSGYKEEMFNRFKIMENEQINDIYKADKYYPTIVIIIDGLENYNTSDDYRASDTVISSLACLCRLGKSAGIVTVLSCQRPTGNVIPTNIYDNVRNKIALSNFDESGQVLLFGDPIDEKIPFGKGLLVNNRIDPTLFTIDRVQYL